MYTYLSIHRLETITTEEEAVAYIALKILYDKMLTKDKKEVPVYVTPQSLYYELSGLFKPNRTTKAKLEEGIQGLIEADTIQMIETDNKGNYILDLVGLKIDVQYDIYVKMSQEEIRKIFNIPYKQRFNLLRFAVCVFSTINSKNKCGFSSYSNMSWLSGVQSKTTCATLLHVLEDYKVLYVRHSDTLKRDLDGKIKNLPNCYGRPEDKKEINAFYEQMRMRQGYDFTYSMGFEEKAKVTRNYNKYLKGTFKGDVKELIRGCIAYNRIPYNGQNPDWQKDMSVFPQEMVQSAEEEMKIGKVEGRQKKKEEPLLKETELDINNLDAAEDNELRALVS